MDSENELPNPCSMWKVFYNTITVIFKNLDSAENNLKALANTILSSQEFSSIFIPRYDLSLSSSQNQSIQKQYEAFTMWLLSRLFFVLSCEKLEKVHDLFIETQLKILDILRLQQPDVYDKMVNEYNGVLTELNELLNKERSNSVNITLVHFAVDDTAIRLEDLNLTSKFIHLKSTQSCILLQQKTLKILTKVSIGYVDRFYLTPLSKSILNNIIANLEKSAPRNKIIAVEYYVQIARNAYFQFKDENILQNHFRRAIHCLLQIYVCELTNNYFNLKESTDMEKVYCDMFDVLIKDEIFSDDIYICRTCENLCEAIMKTKLRLDLPPKEDDLLSKAIILLKQILDFHKIAYKNIKCLLDYVVNTKCFSVSVLLEYQIIEELRQYTTKASNIRNLSFEVWNISQTWKLLYDKMNLSFDFILIEQAEYSMVTEILQFSKNILQIARNTYISFCEYFFASSTQQFYQRFEIFLVPVSDVVKKLMQIQEKYIINTKRKDILDILVDNFNNLISSSHINQANQTEVEQMICVLSYPFLKDLNFKNVQENTYNLLPDDSFKKGNLFSEKCKAIENLSSAMVNVCFSDIKQYEKVNNWILEIFNFCLRSRNTEILCQVAKCALSLFSTNRGLCEFLWNFLNELIMTNDVKVLQILTESLGSIVCVLSGNYTVVPIPRSTLEYKVFCLQCDFVKHSSEKTNEDEKQKLYRKLDDKCFMLSQFIIQKNHVQTKNSNDLILLLHKNDVIIKRNMLHQLPRFLKHISQMHCIPITKQWLTFMTDDDKEIRKIFSSVIKVLIENCQNNEYVTNEYKKTMLETCLKALRDACQFNLKSLNNDLLESLLDVIQEVGCLQYSEVVYTTIKLLIIFILLCQTNLFLTAVDYLNRIAKAHDMTPQVLYITYKKEFCRTLAEMTVYSCCSRGGTVFQCLERISLAFGLTTKDILTRDCHHLLPYFIPLFIKAPRSKKILQDLSAMIVMEPSELFVSYFPYIYPHVYLNEKEEIFKECVNYIQEVTKTDIYILKRNNTKVIHSELLMHIYNKRDLVLRELYSLAHEESNFVLKDSNNRIKYIVDYLQPRFLGVLVYFDTKLVSKNVTESIKKQILQSLPEILKLMGPQNITPLRFKVLAILRTALSLTEESNSELICNNWDVFVRSCDVASLGPLLSTIFISILPLFKLHPMKINSIFKYLIIENEKNLEENLADLFFLSETNVNAELQDIVKKYVKAKEGQLFTDKLKPFLKHINHENVDVRLYGLKYLKKFLKTNSSDLKEIILGDNGMDPILVELIEVLIAGCRKNDDRIRLASGECIGELGAIEPSHFPRKYTQKESKFPFYITDDEFVVNALKELLRAFQTEKDTQNMNRFALAIQEFLKVYEISADESSTGYRIWMQFPENMQELMLPLLSSRYSIAAQSVNNYTHPICESSFGKTYRDWLHNWVSFLISLIQNDKKSLLQVCMPSLKCDDQTLMFFLPYILVHALIECSDEERTLIYNEFIAVLNFYNTTPESAHEHLQMSNPKRSSDATNDNTTDDKGKNDYIKVIFVLFDYLRRWLRECECISTKNSDILLNTHYKTISTFLELFCKLQIAHCNFQRGEYTRAILYTEEYIEGDKTKLKQQLGFLTNIYAKLEEPDGVAGAMDIQETEPPLETMIIAHNMSGKLQNAAACYDKMAQERTLTPKYLKEMVRCYLDLDNPFTAFGIAEGALGEYPECEEMLLEAKVEAFWRLNSYDALYETITRPEIKNSTNWGVRMGHALLNFRKGNRVMFEEETSNMRKTLVDMLSITSLEEGVYRQGYPHIINLHILNELQKAEELVHKITEQANKELCEQYVNELIDEWDLRLEVVQASVPVVEPILRLRRVILEQSLVVLGSHCENVCDILKNHIGKYWLKSAQFARKAKIYQQAYTYLLKAEQYKPISLFLEKAKLYWAQNNRELATNTLKRGLEQYFPDAATFKDMDPAFRKEERKLCAEVKLLSATYIDETSLVDVDANIANFKEAVELYRESEKSHVCLAQYYDKLLTTFSDADTHPKSGDMQVHIIHCYGKSLQYGSKFIYQSMPRMLSIWLDYGTHAFQSSGAKQMDEIKAQNLKKMTRLIDTFLDRLPAYMFFSAFSQLTSRICHPVREVYAQIKLILIKLILCYPQQSMWMLLSVSKSAYAIRTKRCQEILQDMRIRNSNVMRLIYDFNRLAEKLIELCNKPLNEGITTTSVSTILRALPRLLQTKEFTQIILPIQKLRKLILPNPKCNSTHHNPFPNYFVYIQGIEDEVQVLQSLQRPRKITFRGSDGKKYIHMLKPKDDLRKDCRLMEFNDVVNLFLHRDADARQRRLYIRTYSVVPLNEECGIVEWLDNLVGLRPILMNTYKQKGIFVGARELKSMVCNIRDSLARKRQVFEEKMLPRHPPVLSEWFKCMFPDVHFWYQARTAYIRTCAVMSMVGNILGLGDRHGENILFDSTNGDTVHVDFNCLFNKGETFDWPERVPFRLTHNMVDAMGPLGVNGLFRKSCVVTLNVLKVHKDALMSIVRPFVYDPLVSWPRNTLVKVDSAEAERTNEQAVEHIRNIEMRLKGSIKSKGKMTSYYFSTVGQVNNLIEEATSIDNLCQMYIGWGAYL